MWSVNSTDLYFSLMATLEESSVCSKWKMVCPPGSMNEPSKLCGNLYIRFVYLLCRSGHIDLMMVEKKLWKSPKHLDEYPQQIFEIKILLKSKF